MTRVGIGHKVLSVLVMSAIAFISVVGAYPVYASPHSRFLWKMPSMLPARHVVGPMLVKILRKNLHTKNDLGLSEQQNQQLEEEFQRFEYNLAQLRQEFRSSKQTVRPSRTWIGKQSGANGAGTQTHTAKLKFRKLFTQHMTAILNILTPEQRAKLRHRSVAVLMLYMLGAELHTFFSTPRPEELTQMPSVHIERTAEHPVLSEDVLGDCAVYEHLHLSMTDIPQHQTILRI